MIIFEILVLLALMFPLYLVIALAASLFNNDNKGTSSGPSATPYFNPQDGDEESMSTTQRIGFMLDLNDGPSRVWYKGELISKDEYNNRFK